MMERVDILTAPSRDTKRSSQGTVAARATKQGTNKKIKLKAILLYLVRNMLPEC
jgi:hypothetical protein